MDALSIFETIADKIVNFKMEVEIQVIKRTKIMVT